MPGLQRRLQRTNKDQYTLTIPKQLVQLLGWAEKQQIIFGFEKGKITISPVDKTHPPSAAPHPSGLIRTLQTTPKQQYILTIPKALVQLLGLKDKQEILFGFERGKVSLTPVEQDSKPQAPSPKPTGGDAHE